MARPRPTPESAQLGSLTAASAILDLANGLDEDKSITGLFAFELAGPAAGLTEREQDVLRVLAQGQTNKEIAAALGISHRTVQPHSIHIYRKLQVDTRAAAALLAARHGLV